jgi:hypothetical protein
MILNGIGIIAPETYAKSFGISNMKLSEIYMHRKLASMVMAFGVLGRTLLNGKGAEEALAYTCIPLSLIQIWTIFATKEISKLGINPVKGYMWLVINLAVMAIMMQ